MSNSIVTGNSDTLTTADKQKFIMDKIRQDEVTLYRDTYLGDTIFEKARQWETTDQILVWIWDNDYGKKYGLMPQAIDSYLTKRGMGSTVRKALRAVPILEKVDEGLMKRVEAGSDKVLIFMKEKLDKDFQKAQEIGNVTVNKQITQININVVGAEEDEKEDIYEVNPE